MNGPTLLAEWRRANGVSQETAAKALEVRQSTWSAWETDRSRPHVEQAVAIERYTAGAVPVEAWASKETPPFRESADSHAEEVPSRTEPSSEPTSATPEEV